MITDSAIPEFSPFRILVVGDVMLDRYWSGDSSRISPEAPVPVVKIAQCQERPGGAANVALNVRALGAKATLIGLIGDDEAGQALQQQLHDAGVDCALLVDKQMETVTKLRVLSHHQQLIRLDFETTLPKPPAAELLQRFRSELAKADAVIFSDYNKGCLTEISEMIALANDAGVATFIDPKQRSWNDYHGATVVTPNLREFQLVAGPCHDQATLLAKGEQLLVQHDLNAILLTRGEEGMTLLKSGEASHNFTADAQEVFDVTGAGDTVIALLATAFAATQQLTEAAFLANTAAGIAVTKLGAATVTPAELRRTLRRQRGEEGGIMDEKTLLMAIADARAHGERIVMTNGCFDILHAGHVSYLDQAKKMGDRLIIAVNDDQSVKRLKGEARPVNPLSQRMMLLAALAAVDWVVPFSEDTPQRLIEAVAPDVLVKGGDYKVDEIAGSDFVLKQGGRVELIDLVAGCSTSSLLERVKA